MQNIHLVKHPLIEHKLSILRDIKTQPYQFRLLVDEITSLLIFEATRDLPLKSVEVQTPVGVAQTSKLAVDILICPILRAALAMLDSVFKIIPDASVGFLGFQRDEQTLDPHFYYAKFPSDAKKRVAIVIDPMFATGGTAVDAVNYLKEKGIEDIRFVALVAAPEGIEKFVSVHPDVSVYVASIDEKLNELGYIVPGLGDAGDRVFNTF